MFILARKKVFKVLFNLNASCTSYTRIMSFCFIFCQASVNSHQPIREETKVSLRGTLFGLGYMKCKNSSSTHIWSNIEWKQ